MFTFESLIDDSLFASEGFCSSSSLLPTGDSPGQTSAAFVASPSSSCDNEGSFSSASTAYTTAAAGSPASSPPFAALAQDPLKLAASLSSHHQLQLQEEEQACLRSSGKMTSSGVSELDPQQPFFENSLPTPPLSSTASPPSPTYFSLPQSCTPLTSSSSSTSTTGGPLESGANEVMDLTCLMVDSSSASHRNNSNAFAWDDTPLRLDLNSIDPASMVSSVVDSTSAMSLGLDPSLVFGTAPMDLTTDASSIMPNLDMVMSMAANTASTDIHHLLQLQPMEPSLNFLSASPSQLLKNPQHHHVILPSQAKQSPGKMQIVKREDGKNIVKRSLKSSVDLRQKVLTAAKKASASKMQCVDDDDDIDADLDDDMEEDEVRRAARVRLSSFLESDETPLSSGIPFSTTTTASQFPSISAACSASIATWPLPSSRVLQDKDARKRSRTGSVSSHPSALAAATGGANQRRRASTSQVHEAGAAENVLTPLVHPRLQVLTGLALHTPAASPLAVTGCPPNFFQQQMSMTVSGTVSPTSPTDASFPMKREEDEDEDDESDESDAEDAPAGGHVAVPIRCVQVSPPPDPITPPSDDVIEYSEVEEGSDEEEGDGKDYYPPITYSRNCQVRPKLPGSGVALVEGGAGGQGRKGSVSKRHHPYKDYALANSEGFSADGVSAYVTSVGDGATIHPNGNSNASTPRRKSNPTPRRRSTATTTSTTAATARRNAIVRTTLNSTSSLHIDPLVPLDVPTPTPPPPRPTAPAHNSTRPVPNSKHLFERTYSSVSVYEMNANGTGIMRRCCDGWMNATHLLKVAGFVDKAKRTKVLEKEIHCGVHEKIQGGYGRYQGTWVPLERAKFLAHKFEVYEVLQEILER